MLKRIRCIGRIKKQLLGIVLVLSLVMIPMLGVNALTPASITRTVGWFESLGVQWSPVSGANGYNVYYKPASAADSQYKRIDGSLIRRYSSHFRADIPGLAAGNYVVKIVPTVNNVEDTSGQAVTQSIQVRAHVREGFAFSAQSPNKTSSGGYNNDGTVPSNAQIIYVTPQTANTVTLDVITSSSGTKTTCTGLVNILAARQKGYDKTPLIIRMIGQIKDTNITGLNSSGYIQVKGCFNITIEGIGEDATAYGWGILVRDATNIEIRNLGFMLFPDDAVSLDTNNKNIWVHNNDFFYGKAGSDADQAKGDGSSDVKGNSTYVTLSYNHYWDSGKASLCGMSDTTEFFVTYHRNWFDHSDSRHPRIRVATVHVYNNYFDGNSKYGVGNTNGGSAFVEANYFRNCKYPMMISKQGTDIFGGAVGTFSGEPGGMLKAFNNIVEGATRLVYHNQDATQFDAYLASARNEQVPSSFKTVSGGNTYNNFDTSSTMYSYTVDAPSNVRSVVTANAGRMSGGDFKWTFTTADDTDSGVNAALMSQITGYTSGIIGFGSGTNPTPTPTPGGATPTPTPTKAPTPTPTPGGPTPTPTPTPPAGTLFSDDFEDGDYNGWTVAQSTFSIVTDGTKALYHNNTSTEGRISAGNQSWANYSVKASIKVDNYNSSRVLLCGRYKDANNYYAASLYNGTTLELRKKVGGSSTNLATKALSLPTGTYHAVELEMIGTTIKVYVNGTLQLTATDRSLASGAIGLVPMKTVNKYDNIVVTSR